MTDHTAPRADVAAPSPAPSAPLRVLVAGGGTAALEAALALRALAGDRVTTTVLAPAGDYVDRPSTVREPFAGAPAARHDLGGLLRDAGATHVTDSLAWVDTGERVAHTTGGAALPYDELVIAVGARMHPSYPAATTLDDRSLGTVLGGLVQDVETGHVRRIAFVVPDGASWPLPLYELALQTAERAYDSCTDVRITFITPERAPLAVFGPEASAAVAARLQEAGIAVRTGAVAQVPSGQRVLVAERHEAFDVDRVVTLPVLVGPGIRGLPLTTHGFLPVDPLGAVRGTEHVHAAGDATDFAVKHGGIAAQQADVVATVIARAAGADVTPRPVRAELRGLLLTGRTPVLVGGRVGREQGFASSAEGPEAWAQETKIASRHLAAFLEGRR
ncbi:FAD-dependent oxidoreductase [Paraconexibacter antarcticus]|uniref:FAD-dependent oxidoreductase n=1 Tax=Paraconexibacter antarcticus TaxID=2949664 RepID=A0ABY5DWD8_9ACTN|nr:FAD-dependent oxidoreductase [Paraconexibacter antarcticus]UTI66320.1 FAD-dependent oxidoreductase [Paraconexibacter antarcticus]